MYKELVDVVSTAALVKIESELASIGNTGMQSNVCTYRPLLCLGLPCAHMLTQYQQEGHNIPLNDVLNFWKKFSITPFIEALRDDVTINMEMDVVWSTFASIVIPQKMAIKRQLQYIGQASSTSILEPKQKVNERGRKKGQRSFKGSLAEEKSTKREPSAWDSHCGFRVVASFYGWDNDGWKIVNKDLTAEFHKYGELYNKVLSPFSSTTELLLSLECYDKFTDGKNWMIMSYMGNVISSCQNVVVLLISKGQCLSFFPLRGDVPVEDKQRMLVFGYINGSHFVRMELLPDCLIPLVSKMWTDHHNESATRWAELFSSRIDKFKKLIFHHVHNNYVEFIDWCSCLYLSC
ncbi:uncharacterized protein LOC119992767 [Tripterygium wilfordii]|uniref:uncharacterized protein LOC119992767 n=1 Tax=Tripterygium wilfordii TaxID=458696 RepID=UPI0018F83674|nr:uncharacterized protein LOC119992767 [Tripterygium wilfordii]